MKPSRFLLLLPCLVSISLADTLIVTNTLDSGSGSLRGTLASATNGDVINFDSALNGATITLTSGELLIENLEISIDASALSKGISISGNGTSRVFAIINNSEVSLRRLSITDGLSNSSGGAVYTFGILNLSMTDCVVKNSASGAIGGGLGINAGLLTPVVIITRCRFQGCSAVRGGGISFFGQGLYSIENSVVAGNSAADGGGICNLYAEPTLVNCTIQGNIATGTKGGGITTDSIDQNPGTPTFTPTIRNTVIWDNRGNAASNLAEQQLRNVLKSEPNLNYSLVEGANGSSSFADGNKTTWQGNNLDGTTNEPSFLDAIPAASAPTTISDLRLFTGSSCLNVGDNSLVLPMATDLVGKFRIQELTVDLGAFEGGYETFAHLYPALSPVGDDDNNGSTNLLEYSLGANPTDPSDSLPLPSMSRDETSLLLTLTQRNNAADLSYDWETTVNLTPLDWDTMVEGIHYAVESITNPSSNVDQFVLRLLGTDPRRFYRQTFEKIP